MKQTTLLTLLILALFIVAPATAAGTNITLSFQDVSGLLSQDIRVFDDSGTLVTITNSTGTATLDYNASSFYILQIQPSTTNTSPNTMLASFFALFSQYWHYVALILLVVILFRRR